MTLLVRRSTAPQYADYKRYKPFLREDFAYGCAYCTIHENQLGGPWMFHVEHFRPKSRFPKLETDYANLLYACAMCNQYKGNDWPSDDPLADPNGRGYLDPCEHDFAEHFRENAAFNLDGLSLVAVYMIEQLHLNRRQLVKLREWLGRREAIFQETMVLLPAILASIEQSLRDAALPAHAVASLTTAQTLLRAQETDIREEWNSRLEPLYELEDFT